MQKRTLAELKAAYAPSTPQQNNGPRDSNYYPFWDMQFNEKAIVRFVPDLNEDNPRSFMVEKVFHNLVVNGQKTSVPCLGMYDEECPICKLSSDYYKQKDEINGKKYYKKRQYIAQALIVEDPLPTDATTGAKNEGKLKFLAINYQLYKIIQETFSSDDLEFPPEDLNNGYDFTIKKTEQGKYASYTVGTKFSPRSRSLTESEMVVAEDTRVDLSTLLPKNPGIDKVRSLLNADINGDTTTYTTDDSGDDYDQPALSKSNAAETKRVVESQPVPTKTVEESADDNGDINSVLEAIRARRANKST